MSYLPTPNDLTATLRYGQFTFPSQFFDSHILRWVESHVFCSSWGAVNKWLLSPDKTPRENKAIAPSKCNVVKPWVSWSHLQGHEWGYLHEHRWRFAYWLVDSREASITNYRSRDYDSQVSPEIPFQSAVSTTEESPLPVFSYLWDFVDFVIFKASSAL